MFVKAFKEIGDGDINFVGGKGASLAKLVLKGVPVPDGFVVLSPAFDRFIEETDINIEIESTLHKLNHEDINSVNATSNLISSLILSKDFPSDLKEDIVHAFSKLNAKFVAVRSSATAEDSSTASWAGELESFLNTTEDHLFENIKKCWASLFAARAIFYRIENNMKHIKISVAVVVQTMIQSEVSGICFTVNPITKDHDQMVIEAGFGLGEAIVGGEVTPDTYVINKNDLNIIDKNISSQKEMLIKDGDINKKVPVAEAVASSQKITDEEILKLVALSKNIESEYQSPQDIEWGYVAGQFYILQSRPITTL